jgi:predicted amidohydrolase YtcJ
MMRLCGHEKRIHSCFDGLPLPLFELCRTPKFVILSGAKSLTEVVSIVSERAAKIPSGKLIIASCFNHNTCADRVLPTRADIDHVPNPFLLLHICGRTHVANSRMLGCRMSASD